MIKIITISLIIQSFFLFFGTGEARGSAAVQKDREKEQIKETVIEAKNRIRKAGRYKLNDVLRFLPDVSIGRRAPYSDYNREESETYVSATISINKLYDISEIANIKDAEKRKAIMKVETIAYNIEKLVERKRLIEMQIDKLNKILKSTEEILEILELNEKIDKLELSKNETLIEIKKLYAEIEYTCIDIEK